MWIESEISLIIKLFTYDWTVTASISDKKKWVTITMVLIRNKLEK